MSCKIFFENYNGTYYPNTEIRGRVECNFDEETSLRGIKIRLKCKEHNEWTGEEKYRDSNNSEQTRFVTLKGENNVLHNEQILFGSTSSTQTLGRGRHVYPFSFYLPDDIPSSFSGPHGSITYSVKATVDRPMRFDYEDEIVISVVSPIDFNRLSKDFQEPVGYSDEKTICCWCCQGGNISLDVQIPKTGFVPGETIPFKVAVSNLSNSNVDDVKVKFKKIITYKVTSPQSESKQDAEDIISFKEHGVGAHGQHTFNLQLSIPQHIVVPNFARCTLFEVGYLLQVSCGMGACTMDPTVDVWDIKMGHIQKGETRISGTTTNVVPSMGGVYPPPSTGVYPPSPGGVYPPPSGGGYSPPSGGMYSSPTGGVYPPPTGGTYPPPTGGTYSPPVPSNPYVPSPAATYPPQGTMGFVAPGQPPTVPYPMGPSAPYGNPKAMEAANVGPTAPAAPATAPQMPPPSYGEAQKTGNFYSPN